jgi:hypothetical protein
MIYTKVMKYKILIVACIATYSSLSCGCDVSSISSYGKSATEAIEIAQAIIPHGSMDKSHCTSPIISCDVGFNFDESGEYCVNGTEVGEVKATVATKTI